MKDWAYLTTVEEMEQATNSLLENGSKVGADSWQQRVKNQTPHCGFGESGTCCRICSMGPCRITKKAPRGICGCDVHGIVGRNYLRFTAGGSATHSDHGREIMHTLYQTKEGGNYQVKDPEKLIRIAKEWGVETEGKDIYDLAHEMAEIGLLEYGKPFGVQRFLKRAPEYTQKLWHEAGIEPRAIDREVSTALHMTHMGCSSLPEALIRQALRAGLSDGWGGSMMGTEFSDVMFGTPKPIDTTANIGVMEKDNVNIVVHGHDPSLSEMVVYYANDPEMIAYAKSVGAKGITGYNGMPKGCSDDEYPWERDGDQTKYPYVVHAELNAVLNANGRDLRGSKLYVALFPCNECAKAIIQSGVKEVYYLSDKYADTLATMASKRMMDSAGVRYIQMRTEIKSITLDFTPEEEML